MLDITITGQGTRVTRFQIDGVPVEHPRFGTDHPGAHGVETGLGG